MSADPTPWPRASALVAMAAIWTVVRLRICVVVNSPISSVVSPANWNEVSAPICVVVKVANWVEGITPSWVEDNPRIWTVLNPAI